MLSEKHIQPTGLEDDKVQYTEDGDSIIEGSEGVTQRDFDTYRHVADRLPYTAWLVLIVEFAERYFSPLLIYLCFDITGLRWTYYGTANIFSNYIRASLPPGSTTGAVSAANRNVGIAGALGQGVQKAFAISECAHLPRSFLPLTI
jgi:POT family proton-dependent oligopeptide transporter